MSLTTLAINNLRNLISVKISLSPKINLFYGANGSGKTSLLEAIYYLGLGRSFRNRLNSRIIHYEASHFSLFSQLIHQQQLVAVGLERQQTGELRIRKNQENVRSIVEISKILPLQLLNNDSRQLLTGSSKIRRQFIDWGTFHVEPDFLTPWQQAQRALKQRNAALKTHSSKAVIQSWDHELILAAGALDAMRRKYIEQLKPVFSTILNGFFTTDIPINLEYKPGWDPNKSLLTVLAETLSRDLHLGYTQYGPQRANLSIRLYQSIPVQDILSQGQQKLLVYALHLAQGQLLKQQTGNSCIYLCDDLPAELDSDNQLRVTTTLCKMNAQVFITGVDSKSLNHLADDESCRMFHVEHGEVR